MKKTLFIIGFLFIILAGVTATNLNKREQRDINKLNVVTTLFPLYDFAKNIGGDQTEVTLLLPPGVEAHSFEPKPSDIAKINEADLFVYTGKFMEPWAEDIIKSVTNKNIKFVDASLGIELMEEKSKEQKHNNEHDEEEDAHGHGGIDPHIWLDFDNAKMMVNTIAEALMEKDPQNIPLYRENAENYKAELTKLDDEYKKGLAFCQSKEIIYGGHYAFGYLARRFNLKYYSVQGFSPDSEPTAKDIIDLVDQIKRKQIKYIFYEELTSPKIAEALAGETETKMLLLNAAHNLSREDFKNNTTFISLMKQNLHNLKIGLQCR